MVGEIFRKILLKGTKKNEGRCVIVVMMKRDQKINNARENGSSEVQPCIRCGEETDNRLGDVYICVACYQVRSSCCPEFGPDDLSKELHYDETKD